MSSIHKIQLQHGFKINKIFKVRNKNQKKISISLTDLKRALILIFLQPRRFIWDAIDRYIVASKVDSKLTFSAKKKCHRPRRLGSSSIQTDKKI